MNKQIRCICFAAMRNYCAAGKRRKERSTVIRYKTRDKLFRTIDETVSIYNSISLSSLILLLWFIRDVTTGEWSRGLEKNPSNRRYVRYIIYSVLTKAKQKRSYVETPHPFVGFELEKRSVRNSLGKELSRRTVPYFSIFTSLSFYFSSV